MRATIGDVVKHPTYAGDWWVELPGRDGYWWKWLLTEPGSGWLRWKPDWATAPIRSYWEPPEDYRVFPPLHRLWLYVAGKLRHPIDVAKGSVAWNESLTWSDVTMLRDDDRKRGHR